MKLFLIAAVLAASPGSTIQGWMEVALYPVLFGILAIASLGLPIPEDVPLIVAGVILKTHPEVASWPGACIAGLCGIMVGDLVLYTFGRRWGRDVVLHRWFRSIITRRRFDKMADRFHRWGVWMCFFGRFFVGVRAVMCITAGATRFPYWKFFIADFCGALLSVPAFIWLGYHFAYMLPTLVAYLGRFQWIAIGLVVLAVALYVLFEWRRMRGMRRINRQCLTAQDEATKTSGTSKAAKATAACEAD